MPSHLLLFTDGSVRGNPGPAGIGVVVADENGMPLKRFGEQLPPCTNNEAVGCFAGGRLHGQRLSAPAGAGGLPGQCASPAGTV
jgi:hypothetical protein